MPFASYKRPLSSMLQEQYYSQPAAAGAVGSGESPHQNIYDLPGAGAGGGDLTGAIAGALGADNGIGILGPTEPPTQSWIGQQAQFQPSSNGPALGAGQAPGAGGASPYGVQNWDNAMPGGVNWRGPVLNPGVSRGYYSGGPARMNMVIDPRTGKRAVGAANILASMSAAGFKPKGDPNWGGFSFEQAEAMRQEALAGLANAPNDPYSDPDWQAWLRSGAPMENGEVPNFLKGGPGPFNEATQYDWQGNFVGPGGEGGGFGPGGGGGDWPAGPGWGESPGPNYERDYEDWLRANGMLGWNE